MSDVKTFGMESWQTMFHDQWARETERRAASVPDSGDWSLYDGQEDEEPNPYSGTYSEE